jgi:cytochrome c biogenesis protein CcdA
MPEQQISLLIAFRAGMVSFVSQCIQHAIPAYVTNLWDNSDDISTPDCSQP